MCDNTIAINSIASDIKQLKLDVGRIERHLDKQNGRISEVEKNVTENIRDIKIQENKCLLRTEFEGKNYQHMLEHIEKTSTEAVSTKEKMVDFAKNNGVQVAEIVAIVGMFGKISGWW